MIGTSDGEQFATPFEHSISASGMGPTATEKPAGALKQEGRYLGSGGGLYQGLDWPLSSGRQDPFEGSQERLDNWRSIHDNPTPAEEKIPTSSLNPNIQNVLSQPHIAEAIANPKIDRTHDVPYVAGASAKPDDFTTHVDQHIPTTATISGKTFDPAIPLNIHEQVEREVMNNLIKKGMTDEKAYEIAHHEYAEPAEDAWYKAQGIDVKDVNHWWDQQNKVTEKEKSTDLKFPPSLYKKPYPHDEVEGMKHEHSNVSAEWATSTKVAMDDHMKYNPADALNPMAEPARLPAAPKGVGEFIEAPAVMTNTGKIFKGKDNHTEAFQAAKDAGFKHGDIDKTTFGGFSTSSGRYVDRREALGLAIINGQFTGRTSDVLHDMLMSHQVEFSKGMVSQKVQQQQGKPPDITPSKLPEGFSLKEVSKGIFSVQHLSEPNTHYAIAKSADEAIKQFYQGHPKFAPGSAKSEREAYEQFDKETGHKEISNDNNKK